MAIVNEQITDAVTQAHSVGGAEALNAIAELLNNIARGLNDAQQGHTSLDELSDAFENAEAAFHTLAAKLASGNK